VFRPQATYFAVVGVEGLGATDGVAFCQDLPKRCGVVAVPAGAFYDDPLEPRPLVRFAFCKQPDVLDEAARRLAALGQSSGPATPDDRAAGGGLP
jgi:N-succinyldiaminopimelate aminotransferase